MNQKKTKFYVVWKGRIPGVYDRWDECKQQINEFDGAQYKSFETRQEASEAYERGASDYLRKRSSPVTNGYTLPITDTPISDSIAVDAACSGNPGAMEYRGVYVKTGQQIFHIGPLAYGTNNVGEFLALVHGLALLKQKGSSLPLYTDSRNAMTWVKKKKCKTLLERKPENQVIFEMIERAERWLATNAFTTQILKWDTPRWGEIPADFGRK